MIIEKRSNITRNLPIKIICPQTRHRIINKIIFEEYILSIWNKRNDWTNVAKSRLLGYGINLSESILNTYRRQIREGERDPTSAPIFSSDLFNGDYTSRYGKDCMYKQFELLRNLYVKRNSKYIGLPASQILSINRDIGSENVFACERDRKMVNFMFDMQRHFSKPPHATIINKDIFNYLEVTNNTFSIFDFDLMCTITSIGLLDKLVHCIIRTAEFPVIVNIVTSVGRSITDIEYRSIMPYKFIDLLSKHNVSVTKYYSNNYNDRITPMRYEFFVLEGENI